MKKILIVLIFILLAQPMTASAYFYRTNSDDTAFVRGAGVDNYGQAKIGYGFNIKPLANYGYAIDDAQPIVGAVTNLGKRSVTLNWRTLYMSRSQIEYGVNEKASNKLPPLYWDINSQKYSLKDLLCGTKYYYRISAMDVAGSKATSDLNQFQTLSCQTNLLLNQEFDLITVNGKLELTSQISGKTKSYLSFQHGYTIGIPGGAVKDHSQFVISRPKAMEPQRPSITTGLFPVYDQPVQLTLTNLLNDGEIKSFLKFATIEVTYADGKLSNFTEDSLKIAYYDDDHEQWLVLPTEIDSVNKIARAQLQSMGFYWLLASVPGWLYGDLVDGSIYQASGSDKIYYIDESLKHYVPNLDILHSWSYKTSHTQANNQLYRVPRGSDLKFSPGSIVRIGAATYYYIIATGKRMFMNRQVFDELGFADQWAYPVTVEQLADYPNLPAIIDSTTRPDGVLIKYDNSPKVYLIANGKKRWIVSEPAFKKNHYRWDRIITIPLIEIYADGLMIE